MPLERWGEFRKREMILTLCATLWTLFRGLWIISWTARETRWILIPGVAIISLGMPSSHCVF